MALRTFTFFCNHHHYSSSELCRHPKQKCCPTKQHPIVPGPLATPILSAVSMILATLGPHVSGIIQYKSCCDWLTSPGMTSSGVTHVVTCVRVAFLFKAEQCPIVCVNLLRFFHFSMMDTWAAPTFWLLGIMLPWMWACKYLSPCFQFFSGGYPEVRLPDYMIILCLIFWRMFQFLKIWFNLPQCVLSIKSIPIHFFVV